MATITHHNLTATQINDENGPAIVLEQQEDGRAIPSQTPCWYTHGS